MKKNKLPEFSKTQVQHLKKPVLKHVLDLHLVFEDDLESKDFNIGPKNKKLAEQLKQCKKLGLFRAKAGEGYHLLSSSVYLMGLGKYKNFHPENVAEIFLKLPIRLKALDRFHLQIHIQENLGRAVLQYDANSKKYKYDSKLPPKTKKKSHVVQLNPQNIHSRYSLEDMVRQLSACLVMGSANFDVLKTLTQTKKEKKNKGFDFNFKVSTRQRIPQKCIQEGMTAGEFVNRSRYIAALPGNYLNPELYEKYVRKIANKFNLKLKVFKLNKLEKEGFGGIVSVGKGSRVSPRMIVLEYFPKKAKNKKPLVLVGKGVTFDTGGISLKPAPEMHEMKYDMCGSALSIHSICMAAALNLPINIVCLAGFAENMPDGNAIKPGDVYTTYNQKTVEVQNTDAEGRLILADLLAYASKAYKPDQIFDFATLTGACVIALGHHASGLMTASEPLFTAIQRASAISLDKVWRLPHWDVYGNELKSTISDLRNIGSRAAGTVSAMKFLSHFVEPHTQWAHFDIAGTAWRPKEQGSQPAGPTGWGLRLMMEYFNHYIQKK